MRCLEICLIYIPKLAADVGGTAVYISDWLWQDRQTIAAEQSRAIVAESVLRSDIKTKYEFNAASISQEVTRASAADAKHSTDIAAETLARQQADLSLSSEISLEAQARASADGALGGMIHANKAIFDNYASINDQSISQVHERITGLDSYTNDRFYSAGEQLQGLRTETQLRFFTAEANISATQNQLMVESGRAQTAEAGLQSQISSLLSNTDAVALNSLAELVADYRVNGSGLESRLLFLEGVVAALVAKSA